MKAAVNAAPILVHSGTGEVGVEDSRVSESRLWKEFHSHFSKKNRDRGVKVNHHDFLDLPPLH